MNELKNCCYLQSCRTCPFNGYNSLCARATLKDDVPFEEILEEIENARIDYDYELHLSQKQFLEGLKEVSKNGK